MTSTRRCRITGCTTNARPGRHLCSKHLQRITHYGDPNFTQWTTANQDEIDLAIREARPVEGLTCLERVLVAQGLTKRGTTAREIARILNVTPRTVYRWRHRQDPRRTAA